MVKGMSVVVNVMVSLMSVMSLPHDLCNLSVCTVVNFLTIMQFNAKGIGNKQAELGVFLQRHMLMCQ